MEDVSRRARRARRGEPHDRRPHAPGQPRDPPRDLPPASQARRHPDGPGGDPSAVPPLVVMLALDVERGHRAAEGSPRPRSGAAGLRCPPREMAAPTDFRVLRVGGGRRPRQGAWRACEPATGGSWSRCSPLRCPLGTGQGAVERRQAAGRQEGRPRAAWRDRQDAGELARPATGPARQPSDGPAHADDGRLGRRVALLCELGGLCERLRPAAAATSADFAMPLPDMGIDTSAEDI